MLQQYFCWALLDSCPQPILCTANQLIGEIISIIRSRHQVASWFTFVTKARPQRSKTAATAITIVTMASTDCSTLSKI